MSRFRKRRSYESQLIHIVHDLAKWLNSKQQIDVVLLDFSKACDKIPHHNILLKLQHYGVRGKTLELIRIFLADRTKVVADGETSRPSNVWSGVPQGTVFGLLLFLVYRKAGNFRGQQFSRFKGKSVWNNFCDFYFRDFKWTDLWISVGINYCGFYFRDSVFSPRNRENKNPAKISRYTVYQRSSIQSK